MIRNRWQRIQQGFRCRLAPARTTYPRPGSAPCESDPFLRLAGAIGKAEPARIARSSSAFGTECAERLKAS